MPSRWPSRAAVLTLITASASAAAQPLPPPPPSGAPPAPPPGAVPIAPPLAPREEWYRWQTLIGTGASLTVGFVPGVFSESWLVLVSPLGLGGVVFTGPIVHWAHGRIGRGFGVLGMNMGAAVVGLFVGGIPVACRFEGCDGFYASYGIGGAYVGATITAVIDAAFLSTYNPPPPARAAASAWVCSTRSRR